MNVGDVVLVTEEHAKIDQQMVGVIGVVQELEGSASDWDVENPIQVNFKSASSFTNCVVPASSLQKVGRINNMRAWFKRVWNEPTPHAQSEYEAHLLGLHMP